MAVNRPSQLEQLGQHFSLTEYMKEVEDNLRGAVIPYMFETFKKQCRRKGMPQQVCQKFMESKSAQLNSKLSGLLSALEYTAEDGVLSVYVHNEYMESMKKQEQKRQKVTAQIRSLLEQYSMKIKTKLLRKNIQVFKQVLKSSNVKYSHERDFNEKFKNYQQVIEYMQKVRDFTVEFKKLVRQKIAEQAKQKQL